MVEAVKPGVEMTAEPETDVVKQLRGELSQSKEKRDEYVAGWRQNVDERRGKESDTASDEGRTDLPIDWAITKTKAAQLFSQMPQVRLTPKQAEFDAAVPVVAKVINDMLSEAGIEAVVSECVVDCINASGVAAALVRYEALEEVVQVPALDELQAELAKQEAAVTGVPFEMPMVGSTRITDRRFCIDRVSPPDFLWPSNFHISDWRKAPWLGHTGRCSWPQAKRMFVPDEATGQRGVTDADKEKVIGAGTHGDRANRLNDSDDARKAVASDAVTYDELFYWRHIYHEDEKYYDAIQRVVFVAGIDEPVINEPWKGQKFDEVNGGYLGSCHLPIQVLTLAYISDEAIPPSDSAIIRPMVLELQEARQHMKDQRKHSRPLRWFNVDQVDPTITGDLINGTWQGMIPTMGSGERIIGEVARTAYPRENLEFDRILKADIQEAVSVGPNQQGMFASGERSAAEAQIVQGSFQTEVGQQRAKVAAFVVGIAEVVAGLFALYGEINPNELGAALGAEGAQRIESWDRTRINQKFVFDVRPDSTVRFDAQQLTQQLTSVLNVTAQSGFINPKPLIQRIIELNGLDPAEVMVDPPAKGPEPPKVSFAFKAEDLMNPAVITILMKANMAPAQEEMPSVQRILTMLQALMVGKPIPQTGAPASAPSGAPGMFDAAPEPPGPAFPEWEASNRINTRRAEG